MNKIMPTQTSQLVSNLQTIYNTKLQIKAALGTNSDDFTEYPSLIQAAISEGGGGSSVKVDPLYEGVYIQDMIENEETTADYFKTVISDNFSATAVEEGGEPTGEYEDISWDEIAEFEEGGETVEKIVHVVITGDPHEMSGNAGAILNYGQDYPSIYGNIFPILEDVTLTISEDPSNDGYDYLIEGDLYALNLVDCCAGVEEISQNDFLLNVGQLGFDINVPTQGITAGKYYYFNWLSRTAPNAGTISLVNPLKADLRIVNLDQLNFMDEGVQTTNSYFDFYFYEDSAMTTEVEFDDISDAFVDNNSIQYNLFKHLTNNDTIKYVKAEYYVWASDIDPDTGIDSGTFELDDTFTGAFTNSYTITSSDEVVTSIQLSNNGYKLFMVINGIASDDRANLSSLNV